MTRFANEVTVAHVGRRVSVRHTLPDDADAQHSDVVGRFVAVEDGGWVIERRDGTHTVVDPATIVGSRLLAEQPERPRRGRGGAGRAN